MNHSTVEPNEEKTANEIEQVIVLGAGASASEKAPVQNMLFSEFMEVLRSRVLDISQDQVNIIVDYFKFFWGIDVYDNIQHNYPTFEECLGMLDLAYSRGEGFKCGYTREKINKSRNSLIYLIANILYYKLAREAVIHPILINRLINENSLSKTAFISLNYDIIIDNELLQRVPRVLPDYGIDFNNYSIEDYIVDLPQSQDMVYLLKLHGSLNWLYCPTCNQMELTPMEKGAIPAITGDKKCDDCGSIMDPVIIPPTFYKDMKNPFLQQVFNKVFEVLCKPKKIIFCGYSFPDADIHFKYLLKKAETYRGNAPEIYIVNEHPGKHQPQRDEEKSRYLRFFKNKDAIHYTNLSFEQFCENGIQGVQ
jgi:hypothetical protein